MAHARQLSLFADPPQRRRVGRGRPRTKVAVLCAVCGGATQRYPKAIANNKGSGFYCSAACQREGRIRGLRWRADQKARELDRIHNGRRVRIDFSGYVIIYEPGRRSTSKGVPKGWCHEHRFIMEQVLGRPLGAAEVVHHKNEIKTDNRPENLMVVTRREHKRIHEAMRADERRRLAEYERRYGPLECNDGHVRVIVQRWPARDPLRR